MKQITTAREHIEVTGVVQGVGFRPFVYGLAIKHNIRGYVLNNPEGVVIEAVGNPADIDAFVRALETNPPPLAQITGIRRTGINGETGHYAGFEIRSSEASGVVRTLISPDIRVCDACLDELYDPADRRFRYPFINCTNCGPRFTIIRDLPYDRPYTTMAPFPLCPDCRNEYEDPANRRFHAQPNACPVCGPKLTLISADGSPVPGDPVRNTVDMLDNGRIVAIKGLGGFHLAVDGTSGDAVKCLRERKHRGEKPFALMVGSVEAARSIVDLTDAEERLLTGYERPIVLARRSSGSADSPIPESVAPGNCNLGVMLPYTPLHYLLFFDPAEGKHFRDGDPAFRALVMTSANISEEPIAKDNDEVIRRMKGVADAFLIHDRGIHVRCDDSVLTSLAGKPSFVRRSRGYAPRPVFLPNAQPEVLALGGELKNTLCLTEGNRAFLSQYIGDLENIPTLGFFREAVGHFTNILDLEPRIYAYDLHPDYLPTRYAKELYGRTGDPGSIAVGIQHHHAHIASVMAENALTSPVIGFAMDGTGYGLDSAVWGGEIMIASPLTFARIGRFDYIPLPGGDTAIREPWRTAFSYLRKAFGPDWRTLHLSCLEQAGHDDLDIIDQSCESGLNAPPAGTLGRLFDAAASILGIRHRSAFEGQAAMMLEAEASEGESHAVMPYEIGSEQYVDYGEYPVITGDNESKRNKTETVPKPEHRYVMDYSATIRSVVGAVHNGMDRRDCARAFHETIVASFTEAAEMIRCDTGISTVALSGGCWQNRILTGRFTEVLEQKGFAVYTNRLVPANDGGLALGQAYIAGSVAG